MALLQPSSVFSFYYHQGCVSHRRLPVDRPASLHSSSIKLIGQQISNGNNISVCWSFLRGSKIPNFRRNTLFKRRINCKIHNFHEGILTSEIASTAFTWGTAAVLPFYTFMIVAPKAQITKKIVGSSLPYVLLGMLYAYLLYLSWTPDIVGLIFASKYWMPELSGMANLFSREMTLASAWIHLLVVDLFTARQVYHDGLKHNIETRHSVCFCLLCCPIGILAHNITKAISRGESNRIDGLD